jgi:CelD/BcsL family acetyltransferase involved in cellulose biosynthesis
MKSARRLMAEIELAVRGASADSLPAPLKERPRAAADLADRAVGRPSRGTKLAVSTTTAAGLNLRVYGDLTEVEREWKAFERHADCTVFQAFDWLAKWQQHIGNRNGTKPAIVLGNDSNGQLVFILQLAVETDGLIRRLSWLGSELCDYNAPLLAPHCDLAVAGGFAAVWRDVLALLQADPRFHFDLIDLQKMPPAIGTQRNPLLDLDVLPHPSGAHVATLARSWDEFYAAKRSASTRKRERRQLKHLAEHGEIQFIDVQDRHDIEQTLDTMFAQKTRSFSRMGVEDIFARAGYQDFFRDIATDPAAREITHVTRLDVGATRAAASLGLKFRDCYYLVVSSYEDSELAKLGPGRSHLHELLRHAIDRGFNKFDFTVGDEPYKRDWCETELRLFDYLSAVTMRGRLVVAMTTAFRRTKRFIKQTPVLWQAFSKARSALRSMNPR